MAYPKAFDDDPLRILRVFSFACMCGFSIERKTRSALKKRLKLLSGVSAERIRDELFRLLSSPAPAAYLSLMASDGVIGRIFPEMTPVLSFRKRGMFVWRHTLETVDALDALIRSASRRKRERAYFYREISSGRSYAALLKLAALLHDISKPATYRYEGGKISFYGHERRGANASAEICRRLKLSNDEVRRVKSVVFLHLRPGYLVTGGALTRRSVFRFMRDAGDDSGGILMLALADERATRGYSVVDKCRGRYERVMKDLLGRFFNAREEVKQPKLFDGHMIMKHCRLPAGPLIGSIIRELGEAQAVGEISTREQALDLALAISRRLGEDTVCRK
jgi:putative nucleotidyltransferase with HDIG domain